MSSARGSMVERWVAAPADAVWEVLADGWAYADFVVGSAHMRAVDAAWPGPGARLHPTVGGWPVLHEGVTTCHEASPERRLVMTASGWPLGEARVAFDLLPRDGGTRVRLCEDAVAGPGRFVPRPVRRVLIDARNRETLSRLETLALARTSGCGGRAAG